MKTIKEKTLIHGLYMELKRNLKGFTNYDHIVDLVFPDYLDTVDAKTPLSRNCLYAPARINDFRKYSGYILNENARNADNISYEKIRKDKISSFIKSCISGQYLGKLKETLIDLLDQTDIHPDYKLRTKLIARFERLYVIEKIDTEFEFRCLDEWVDAIYYYFYYAVTDKLHSNFAFSLYPDLEEDLTEYNDKVTMMFGVCGNPGMYQLYSMAERENPNIIALYECGELEYYGKGPSGIISFQNAYRYYLKTCGCNSEHPLATWSIAYMKFHYSVERAKRDQRFRVEEFDKELEGGANNRWYDSILEYSINSYNHGCPAAANLLGQIVDATEDIFPFRRKGKYKRYSSKQLYKESADSGYVYGCNNYATCCLKEANHVSGSGKVELLKEAVKYLKKSADLGNPWAKNRLGCFYLKGLCVGKKVIIDEDKEYAHKMFDSAHVMCRVEDYYWPLINLCESFWLNEKSSHYHEKDCLWIRQEVEYALSHLSDSDAADKSVNDQKEKLSKIMDILMEME